MRRLSANLAGGVLCAALAGCAIPAAYIPVLTAGLGACAAACGPVVNLETQVFDYATGEQKSAAKP